MSSKPAPAKFSIAFGAKRAPPNKVARKPTAGAKRGRAAFDDSDVEDDSVKETTITSFAGGQAIDESKPIEVKGVRVIAPPPGTREGLWLERRLGKKQQSSLPSKEQSTDTKNETISTGALAYGLTIAARNDETEVIVPVTAPSRVEPEAPKKTDDELALQALIEGKPQDTRIITTAVSEKEAFQQAYTEAPDMASLAEYEATPIEGFGAALLRGMGWKDGEAIGRNRGGPDVKPRVLERRPALLGIGAKPEDATGGELGAWGKADKPKGRQQQSYVPVILRNKRTGEEITEEELQKKQEQGKLSHDVKSDKTRRSRSPDRKEKTREDRRPETDRDYRDRERRRDTYNADRDRKRDRDHGRNRHEDRHRDNYDDYRSSKASRRDRSASSDDRQHKRRRDDDYDSHRSGRKDRRRDDDYDSMRDRDRDRRRGDADRLHRDRDSRRERR